MICIDNYHNSYPKALTRLTQIARDALPENPTEQDKDSTEIDSYNVNLTHPEEVRAVFEKYGKGGIWGVIHIAVRTLASFAPLHILNSYPLSNRRRAPSPPSPSTTTHRSPEHDAKQAYKAVGESTEIPVTYYHNNVSATIFLLQAMSEFDCTRFVYSSSATVYGTPPKVPIPETTRLKADSPYGKSKVMSETIIDDLAHGTLAIAAPHSLLF